MQRGDDVEIRHGMGTTWEPAVYVEPCGVKEVPSQGLGRRRRPAPTVRMHRVRLRDESLDVVPEGFIRPRAG